MELSRENTEAEETLKNKYLIFSVNEECYGIQIKYVTEVIEIEKITQVPDLPDYVKGIINLRGKVISVMDARLRFNKAEKEYDDRTCIIVIHTDDISFGLIVDGVKEVGSIDETNISPPPSISGRDDAVSGFLEGIGKAGNDIWLLIDCHKLLNHKGEAL